MNIFLQSLLAAFIAILVLGYFQFRRTGDIVSVVQELFRPQYLVPAALVGIAYLILRVVFSGLDQVL
jgi:hypothetical protein